MITTKGRYALRVMIDLAEHRDDARINLWQICERTGISRKYLEAIATKLAQAKLIDTARGTHGGVKLSRAPQDYKIGEILEAMEETLAPVACLKGEENDCPRANGCKTLPMWKEFNQVVHDFFYSRTLQDLLDGGEK